MSWQHLNQPEGWIGVISLSLSLSACIFWVSWFDVHLSFVHVGLQGLLGVVATSSVSAYSALSGWSRCVTPLLLFY